MSTELTLPQRAAVALGTAEHEVKLIALAKESTDITAVIDPAGRDQAHRIGMTLRAARTNITKTGKAARDDATAFGKAVIAEEKRLVAIIEPEESRVLELRDAFDAKVQSEKDAKIAAERARMDAHRMRIDEMRELLTIAIDSSSECIQTLINRLRPWIVNADAFEEFADQAESAKSETLAKLQDMHVKATQREAEAARQQAEREAAEARAKQEREELVAAQAKLKADQEAAAAQQAALRAELEKNAAIERAAIAEQQAAMDARQRDMDHAEGLMLDAQFDQLAAARKLEEETAAVAVVETATADVVEPPQGNAAVINDRPTPMRPTDNQLIIAVATAFGVDLSDALEWLSTFGQ